MKRPTVDWARVASILGARAEEEIVQCKHCAAQGSVAYIAEHVLTTHATTPIGKQLARVVLRNATPSA
jgi:hypothetical protein